MSVHEDGSDGAVDAGCGCLLLLGYCILMAFAIVVCFYIGGAASMLWKRAGITDIESRLAAVEAQTAGNTARLDAISGDIFHLAEKSELRWSYYEGLDSLVEALLMRGQK
jgi:hypothetical protein